ncbi:MAG: hypothetical protein ACE5F1_09350, partial [Planctomycetota bacterium]
MKYIPISATPGLLSGVLLAGLFLCPGALAQTTTITYDLKNVWLRPDISHPWEKAQQMTGTFTWTYGKGQFENGTGQFTSLFIPWWGNRTSPKLKIIFGLKSIEFTMIGNFHGLGLDLSLRLSPPLAPYKVSPIDKVFSKFTIEVGVARKGHIISGSVVPRCPPPVNYGIGTRGSGNIVPTITSSGGESRIGNRLFRIDCDRLLGGAPCFFLLSPRKTQFQLLGVTVLVDPGGWILLPMTASGAANVPGI